MSDFSKLELLVESKSAVQNLNKVEQSLNKTESAANSLKNVLKSIGVGIGFTALLKNTLQLQNATNALNKRFRTFFGSTGSNVVKDLSSNFALANRNAKELLSTAAKFGSASGLRGNALTNFSSQLTKLAADVAAFNAIDDVNSVLDRFGVATLGRTQGLREFGVQIDTTSEAFKRQIAVIQQQTGATEAQAKQLVILQEAQRQLEYTQGSAGAQVTSAWQQLNNLFSNFKDILSKVGEIFNTLFGPLIRILNSILEIPFVKSTTAWVIAVTTLYVAIGTLIRVSSQLNSITQSRLSKQLQETEIYKTLVKQEQTYIKLKEEDVKTTEKLTRATEKLNATRNLYNVSKNLGKVANDTPEFKKWIQSLEIDAQTKFKEGTFVIPDLDKLKEKFDGISKQVDKTNSSLESSKSKLDSFGQQLKTKIDEPILGALNRFGLIPPEIYKFIAALNLLNLTTKENIITTYARIAAEKLDIATKKIKGVTNSISSWLTGIFTLAFWKKVWGTILSVFTKGFWITAFGIAGKLLAPLKPIGAFLGALLGLAKVILTPVLAIVAIYDSIVALFAGLTGDWSKLKYTVTYWVVNLIKNIWKWIVDALKSKDIKEIEKRIKEINKLKADINDFQKAYDDYLKKLTSNTLKGQVERYNELKNQIENKEYKIDWLSYLIDLYGQGDMKDSPSRLERVKELQADRKKLIDELNKLTEDLNNLNLPQKINEIKQALQESLDKFKIDTSAFQFDEKTGKIIDNKNKVALQVALREMENYKKKLEEAIKTDKPLEEINKIFGRLKTAANEIFRLNMEKVNAEKQKLIEQQNLIKDLVKSAVGYQQTSVQGVAAESTRATELQTRELTGPSTEVMKDVAMSNEKIKHLNEMQAEMAKRTYEEFKGYVKTVENYIWKNTDKKVQEQLIVINY